MKTDSYRADEVFTPTTPARLTFVEREGVNNKLVNALMTPGKQIIVYGHSGSGKTTLLENKLHQTYEKHITTRCTKSTTFEQLMLDAFDQLDSFYKVESSNSSRLSNRSAMASDYLGIKTQLSSEFSSEKLQKKQRVVPPQLTPQTLARFLGEANLCWVLEDFHKVEGEEKVKLAQIMKVFVDMADQYRNLKIIALGAVGTARQVVEADSEMRNRVSEVYVPLMSEKEIASIIEKGEVLLNFALDKKVRDGIVRYSNGLASVCHQLCLNICFASGLYKTAPKRTSVENVALQRAVKDYLDNASDTIKSAFNKALRKKKSSGKFENGKLILGALAQYDQDGATHGEILADIKKQHTDYPSGNLTHYLRYLQMEEQGALLRQDTSSGRYSFSDPIYQVFAVTYFENESLHSNPRKSIENASNSLDSTLSQLLTQLSEEIAENLASTKSLALKFKRSSDD